MLYDIRSNYSIGMLNYWSWSGFKGCIRFAFYWYVAFIFSSKTCCMYSATALVSSLWYSSFLKFHWRRDRFHIKVISDLSKASIMSCCLFGSRSFLHFRELHPLREFPYPIFVWAAKASLISIFLGSRFPGNGGMCHEDPSRS
jgi:hypothetical protein